MKKKLLLQIYLCFLIILVISFDLSAQGFLHRVGKKIVDGNGNEILLKGIGLGGWLVQEGYMLQTSSFANAQWEIKAKITDLIEEANTETFYEKYRYNFIRKIDIDSIRSWGFNSIRLPFHYNLFAENSNPPVFLDKGFEIIDSLLNWCESNQIYLILDMHAAPGGQSDDNISDYNSANLSLWESEQNKDLTVQIWRKIAERYKDKEWIGGYDLINEPKWDLPPDNEPLRNLYIRLTDTIRAVDTNHIVFIEGNWYATDFTGLSPAWDDNMAYSFHKYWNGNTQSSIQYLVNLRNSTNIPMWLGETGENSNQWFVECAELMQNNNIGWAWWTHKKIETITGPLSANISSGYQTLLSYWKGQGNKPTETFAVNALSTQADNLLLENSIYHKDYIDALMRQPFNTSTIPFTNNEIPGIIYGPDYDMGKLNYAYKDVDYENTSGEDWNNGWTYRNDGVDIEACSDISSNGYDVGWIENGEWLTYTANVSQSGLYDIYINIAAANSGGALILSLDGQYITSAISVPVTGGWQNWQSLIVNDVYISAGTHVVKIMFFFGGFNFSSMEFLLTATDVEQDEQNPLSFDLTQNYPNPFNPTTQIEFSIPSTKGNNTNNVVLKVFDALGNEIETLLNEPKAAGNYKIDFVGSKLSSGVYFYKLQYGDYQSIKKMILMK